MAALLAFLTGPFPADALGFAPVPVFAFVFWKWGLLGARARAAQEREHRAAERSQAHAESLAEAVEALRQRQWDAVAEQAYRARGGTGRPASPPSVPPLTAMPGVSTELAGARLQAAFGPCSHPRAEPVDLVTGERVAYVCPDCPAELPADWR